MINLPKIFQKQPQKISSVFDNLPTERMVEIDGDKIKIGGHIINHNDHEKLREEAFYIKNCSLWGIVNTYLTEQAVDLGIKKSKDFDDLKSAKMMLYNLDIINGVLAKFQDK